MGEGAGRREGAARHQPLRPQTMTADDDDDKDSDNKDGPGGGGGKYDSESDAGGGGGGGDRRTVLLLDARASPFLRLDRPKIRQAYRVYVVNN